MAKLDLVVEQKSFFDEQRKEKVNFFECSVVVDGVKIVLKPKAEDKKMFNYLLKKVVK